MINKIFKLGYTIIEVLMRLVYFVAGVAFIFWIAYLFGHVILDGRYGDTLTSLIGNDSTFAISLVYWFEKFYPKIPIWYTVQGMGVSLFYSYPVWTSFLNIVLKNISGMSVVEIYRILSFITFPLTAIGIYLLAWARLKNQTVGLLGGLFFLLSQASWLFQSLHGIFAQSFSFVFVAPAILCFDLFLNAVLKGNVKKFISRIYLVLAVLTVGLTFLMHFVTGIMLTLTLIIWTLAWFILHREGKLNFGTLIVKSIKAIIVSGSVIVLGYGIGAFWLIPFNHYTQVANIGGFNTRDLSALQQESLRIPSMLGLNMLGTGEYRYDFFFFAGSVLVFFAIGVVLSVIKKEKFIIIASLISLFFIFLTTVPIYLPAIASLFKFFFTGVYFRGIIPALILLPIVAAWGVYALVDLISLPFKGIKHKVFQDSFGLVVSALTLTLAFVVVSNFKPAPPANPDFPKSYKYEFQPYGPSLSADFNDFLAKPYLPKALPEIVVNKRGLEGKTLLNEALSTWFKSDDTTVFDVSPYAAGGAIVQGAGILNNSRFVNLYHYYASLIHGMWGYQAGQFYGTDKLYISPKPFADLSDWFGVKYAVVTPGFDPFYKYTAAGWEPNEEFNAYARSKDDASGKDNWGIEVWQNPNATGLFSATNRPAVLVIGNQDKGAYDNTFRTGNLGALTYKDALIVMGSSRIDDYSLSELTEFDGLILNGYSYKSKNGAWNLLKNYMEAGGKVFVDTGWQYIAADWEGKTLPSVLPINKTTWGSMGNNWDGVDTSFDFTDFTKFDPLTYQGGPWNMAIASKSDLKDGAKPLITKGDQVVMAEMNVGKGKIIWSGMNVFALTALTMNEAPAEMLAKITVPLFSNPNHEDFTGISYTRPFPDTATLTFSSEINKPFWLLFREANSPYLNVELKQDKKTVKPKTVKAGPGFIMIRLEKANAGDKLIINEKLNFVDGFLAKAITLVTMLFLVVYLVIGNKIIAMLEKLPIDRLSKKFSINLAKSLTQDEEDY